MGAYIYYILPLPLDEHMLHLSVLIKAQPFPQQLNSCMMLLLRSAQTIVYRY